MSVPKTVHTFWTNLVLNFNYYSQTAIFIILYRSFNPHILHYLITNVKCSIRLIVLEMKKLTEHGLSYFLDTTFNLLV